MKEHILQDPADEEPRQEVVSPQHPPSGDSHHAHKPSHAPDDVANKQRAAFLFSALAAHSPHLGKNEPPVPPPHTTTHEEVMKYKTNPSSMHALFGEALASNDTEKVERMIAVLHSCPECIPDAPRRNEYATHLFHALPPHDTVRLAHYLTIVQEPEVRHSLMRDAVFALAEDLPAHHSLLRVAYEQYTPFLTQEDEAHLFTIASTTHPVLTAQTFHDHPTVAPLITRIHDAILTRLATHPPAKEGIAGTIPLLKTVFGEAVTVALVREMEGAHGDVLYTEIEEVINVLGVDHAHAIATDATIISHDPLVSLKTLHTLSTETGYMLTPEDATVRERATHALYAVAPPQLVLRDVKEVYTYVGDEGTAYEGILLSALRRSLDEGNYQALIQYHAEIEPHVRDSTHVHTYLIKGALQAYMIGDYPAFLSLYNLLDIDEQETMREERAGVERVLTTPISEPFMERHGASLDPESAFSPHDLPFPPKMKRYVANLIRESVMATNESGTYHGKPYQAVYGRSFLATPLERFNTILYADGFKTALQETELHLTYGYVLMLAEGVSNMLDGDRKKANDATIYTATREILRGFEHNRSRAVFGKGVRTIIATHEEPAFNPRLIATHLHERTGGRKEDILFMGKGARYEEGINVVKRDLIVAIEGMGSGPVTIVLDGHGSPENWGFTENTADNLNRSLSHRETSLTYQELGDAIAQSGNPEVTVVVAACFADNYLRNLYSYLRAKNSAILPRLGIADSNTGKYAWHTPTFGKDRYMASHLLNTFAEDIHTTPPRDLTVEDLLRAQGKLLQQGGLGVFLHTEPEPQSAEQEDASKHTTPPTPRILEIVLHAPSVDTGTPT